MRDASDGAGTPAGDDQAEAGEQPASGLSRREVLGAAAAASMAPGLWGAGRTARRRRSVPQEEESTASPRSPGAAGEQPVVGGPGPLAMAGDVAPSSRLQLHDALSALLREGAVALDLVGKGVSVVHPPSPPTAGMRMDPDSRLGHANLRVVQVEHDITALRLWGDAVLRQVEDADVVVPEYYLDEARSSPRMAAYAREHHEVNGAFFDAIAERCKGIGVHEGLAPKDVWVLDPCCDARFARVAGPARGAEAVTFGAAVMAITLTEPFLVAPYFAGHVALRRKVQPRPALEEYIENDVRRVGFAQNLVDLCGSDAVAPGSTVLVITPAGHWDPPNGRPGIAHYVRDAAAREQRLGLYKKIFGSNLFMPRHYPDGTVGDHLGFEALTPRPSDAQRSAQAPRPSARKAPRSDRTI